MLRATARDSGVSEAELRRILDADWRVVGRPKQQPPTGDWTWWWVRAGRGFGKTITGAQWAQRVGVRDDPGCRFALIAPTQGDVRKTMVEGEALALDTLVATPDGFTAIGDLREGDLVLGGDGAPCRVVHAHPVLLDRSCYRVRLKGGAEVVADGAHRWLTEDYAFRAYSRRHATTGRRPTVVSTAELAATLRHWSGAVSQANHGIRVSALEGREIDAPIDPYVLGAWLGDGLSKSGAVCDAEGDVVAEIERAGYRVRVQPSSTTVPVYGVLGLQVKLRVAGLLRNKHVPVAYLRASAAQRLALVQGLMDTDGTISARGQCEFVSSRRGLADDLVDLLCGLGIKASAPREKRTPLGTTHWVVKFTTTQPVFRMRRKLERVPASYRDARHWYVQAAEPTATVPVRCITVDSPDSTYLVTRHHVRTHNTGLLSVLPAEALLGQSRELAWNKTSLELRLANGTLFQGYSSERPDRLRGPQHGYAWMEEVSSWNDARAGDVVDSTFSNAKLGCRLGAHPRFCITSTPKANKLTKALAAIPGIRVAIGSSYENRTNLSEAWWAEVVAPLEGTRTGRQEIHAEILEDVEGALWTAALLDEMRLPIRWPTGYRSIDGYLELAAAWNEDAPVELRLPTDLARVEVGVDPNVTSGENANAAGIVVAAVTGARPGMPNGLGLTLDDRTVVHGGPAAWAAAAVGALDDWRADRIIAEVNNGGDMVELTIKNVDPDAVVKQVRASRGKRTRAEPVAALYTGSDTVPRKVRHVGAFPELEEELTTWLPGDESPNRMDALVWAYTNLMLSPRQSVPMRTHRTRARIPTAADRFGTPGV